MALKVVLLGDSSVGKSSLVNRFVTHTFDPHSANTIGAAFWTKRHAHNGRSVKLEIWDTAGQERYRSLTPMYYRNARVALVCFDLSNAESSFARARYWTDQLRMSGPADICIRVVGTKADVAAELPPAVQDYCAEHGLSVCITSAKSDTGIQDLFDSVVDSLDESFFAQPEPEVPAPNLSLRPSSTCC